MKIKSTRSQIFFEVFFIILFIIFYFAFIIIKFNGAHTPIILLTGFAFFIILVYYINIHLNSKEKINQIIVNFRFFNENSIKVIMIILMFLCFFIRPISFSKTIIDWKNIGILNYFRAVIFLIGGLFIPGACLYNIFFYNYNIHKWFKVQSFIFKLTIYPILSLSFLGTLSLILDQLGLYREHITLILFFSIIGIYLIDYNIYIFTKKNTNISFKLTIERKKISKESLLIIFISISIIIISFGIQLSAKYLIPGDIWRSFQTAYLSGQADFNPIEDTKIYTVYWGYVSYSLSLLSGIPYVNINAMLFPFLYLFIFSLYLFIKALLRKNEKRLEILSITLIFLFSGLFYIFNSIFGRELQNYLNVYGIFNFSFYTFSFISLFLSLALYTILLNYNLELKKKRYEINQRKRVLFLSSFFLIQSYITFFFPIIAGLSFLLIISFLTNNKKETLKLLSRFFFISIILLIIFDLSTFYFFSWIPITFLTSFLGVFFYLQIEPYTIRRFLNGIIVHTLLFGMLLLFVIVSRFYINYYRGSSKNKIKKPKNKLFFFFFGLFSVLLFLEFYYNIFLKIDQDFFLFLLDKLFLNIGFIGIFGIYSSFLLYKTNKKLFYLLSFWTLILIFTSILILIKEWITYPFLSPFEIPEERFFYLSYWFTRIWYFSIIPFSILSAHGIKKLLFFIKSRKFNNIKKLSILISFSSILIFFSFSNTLIAAMYWENREGYYIDNEEAQIIGWVSENIPYNSNILMDEPRLRIRLDDMTFCKTYMIWDEKSEALKNHTGFLTSYYHDDDCSFTLINDQNGHNDILVFNDQSKEDSVFFKIKFDEPRENGSIDFNIKVMDKNKNFQINIYSFDRSDGGIFLLIENGSLFNFVNRKFIKDLENNLWYNIRIDFECSNDNYTGLSEHKWRIIINGTNYGIEEIDNNILNFCYIEFYTFQVYYNYIVYLYDIDFSWAKDYDIEDIVFYPIYLIDHLKTKDISYYIISNDNHNYLENKDLINYFTTKLYSYGQYEIYKKI